ncbi:MAG: hypothetical protein FWH14_00520 [Oscillospiraceae bacterium]|nr:hypothetical protein [Oscillospiraceae bacterium]
MEESKTAPSIDIDENIRVEGDPVQANATPDTSPKPKEPKGNESKEINDVKSFVEKLIGTKFSTQNDGNITTQNIFNIGSMTGGISSVEKEKSTVAKPTEARQYKLYERSDCSAFVSEYKTSLHLAYAIAISMFEYIPVSDLQSLSERLLLRFPKTLDAEGKEDKTHTNPFLSLDSILGVIGAEPCKVSFTSRFENVTERCVCFAEAHDKVMENLWDLFPMIRSEITEWLIETDFIYQFRNAFSTSCFVRAMFNIVKLDFGDSINRLFPQLTSDPKNKYLMMRLFLLLTADEDMKKNACEILKRWAASSEWLWEISLVVFAQSDADLPFKNELERTVTNKIRNSFDDEEDWDVTIISGQMVTSAKLRTMVSGVFQKLMSKNEEDSSKNYGVALIYLLTISNAYQFVDREDRTLPLVAFDNKLQAENIEGTLSKTITDFNLRQGLFDVLGAYLREINEYEPSQELLNRVKSFFYILSKKAPRYYGDIIRFLMRLAGKNKTAEDIMTFLQDKIKTGKELVKA